LTHSARLAIFTESSPDRARPVGWVRPRWTALRGPIAALLLAVGLAAQPALAQDGVRGDVYANDRYGIQITKPSAWYFITAKMIVDLAKRAGGGAPIRGEDDPVKLAGFAVIVSKGPTLGTAIEPQVTLLVHELPAPPADLVAACEGLRTGMSEPETVSPTRPVTLGGKAAIRLDFRGFIDGAVVRATALCTITGRRAFVVVGQALSADFDRETQNFEAILGSFRLK